MSGAQLDEELQQQIAELQRQIARLEEKLRIAEGNYRVCAEVGANDKAARDAVMRELNKSVDYLRGVLREEQDRVLRLMDERDTALAEAAEWRQQFAAQGRA
jgi:RNA polymerase-binding transcription factor DksA